MATRHLVSVVAMGLVAALLCAGPIHGQAIPDYIPDKTDSIQDQERERMLERFHNEVSMFVVESYASRHVTGPGRLIAGGAAGFNYNSSTISLDASIHRIRVAAPATDATYRPGIDNEQMAYSLSVGYEYSLYGLVPKDHPGRRMSLAANIGVMYGTLDGVIGSLGTRYTVPVNEYWSLPLGLSLHHTRFAEIPHQTGVGISIGARLHFGHRPTLK